MMRHLCPPYTPREESSPYGLGADWDMPDTRWGKRARRTRAAAPREEALVVAPPAALTW